MTEKLLEDLSFVSLGLRRFADQGESVLPATAKMIADELDRLKNSLAARMQPARLIVALNDPVIGMDQKPVTVVGSTVPVTMFVVDHRNQHWERLAVVSSGDLGEPSEVLQVVSDEASVYLQQNTELLKSITNNC